MLCQPQPVQEIRDLRIDLQQALTDIFIARIAVSGFRCTAQWANHIQSFARKGPKPVINNTIAILQRTEQNRTGVDQNRWCENKLDRLCDHSGIHDVCLSVLSRRCAIKKERHSWPQSVVETRGLSCSPNAACWGFQRMPGTSDPPQVSAVRQSGAWCATAIQQPPCQPTALPAREPRQTEPWPVCRACRLYSSDQIEQEYDQTLTMG